MIAYDIVEVLGEKFLGYLKGEKNEGLKIREAVQT